MAGPFPTSLSGFFFFFAGTQSWRNKSLFLSKQAAQHKHAELSDAEHLRERLVCFVGLVDAMMLGQLCELLRLGVELFRCHVTQQRKQVGTCEF